MPDDSPNKLLAPGATAASIPSRREPRRSPHYIPEPIGQLIILLAKSEVPADAGDPSEPAALQTRTQSLSGFAEDLAHPARHRLANGFRRALLRGVSAGAQLHQRQFVEPLANCSAKAGDAAPRGRTGRTPASVLLLFPLRKVIAYYLM
ncbi:hypothetical protein [Phreatobacter stygius]|uniref:Uncharacterized protein n=1 Tax=Phreatobacter stygius TaxID=1940610 RepID=A0A4D7BC39_9HYPH|nr:hypothetical protein [Phreatobacter stygius]QCI66956.1 hypothetical protein E8M01_23555 [Phreatobacter stygius]